jgi:hypothetical protein
MPGMHQALSGAQSSLHQAMLCASLSAAFHLRDLGFLDLLVLDDLA